MSDPIQSIARHLGIQTFGDGLLAKIGQTIDLLQEAARNRADLAAECERLREETAVLVGEIAEIEVRRDAALAELATVKKVAYGNLELLDETELLKAELAALKGGQEAVAWAVCREPGKVDALSAAYASESAAKAHVNSYATKGCSGLHVTPLYLAPPAQASAWVQDSDIRSAAARAYGFLWHVNNEPGTPSPMYSAEKAAYRARIALRDMLTTEERGKAINAVGIEIGRYEQPAAPTPGASDGKGGKP